MGRDCLDPPVEATRRNSTFDVLRISGATGSRQASAGPPARGVPPAPAGVEYETRGFPVLGVGPTPPHAGNNRSLTIRARSRARPRQLGRARALPRETPPVAIHCVTQWPKFDTPWTGVSIDALLAEAGPPVARRRAHAADGYETNLPLADLTGGKAWLVEYEGEPLEPPHGGPARLLVPHRNSWNRAPSGRGRRSCSRPHCLGDWRSTATTTAATLVGAAL